MLVMTWILLILNAIFLVLNLLASLIGNTLSARLEAVWGLVMNIMVCILSYNYIFLK